jgi:hypothetical protein
MADYFLVLDPDSFIGKVRPTLATCWRLRTFAPARELCESLAGAARDYATRYHLGPVEPLLFAVARGELNFDRACWRALAGEVLLFSALELPELPDCAEALLGLLAPGRETKSSRSTLIEQALFGRRDVTFGAAVYRPERARWNDPADVAELAGYLAGVDTTAWRAEQLAGLADDLDAELEWARGGLVTLGDLYRRCADGGRMVVIEQVHG